MFLIFYARSFFMINLKPKGVKIFFKKPFGIRVYSNHVFSLHIESQNTDPWFLERKKASLILIN